MYLIQDITASPRQSMSVSLEDGTEFKMSIRYSTTQRGWFLTRLEYKAVVIDGLRICTSLNVLSQFANIIPFGIACATDDSEEPMLLEDFSSGRARLYVLTPTELQNIDEYIRGGELA